MRSRLIVAVLLATTVGAQSASADIFGRKPKAQPASAPAAAAPPAAVPQDAAAKPVPPYAVIEGAHPESADQTQTVTLLCPKPLRSFGVGYTALVRNPAQAPGAPSPGAQAQGAPAGAAWHEEQVTDIRSLPDANGTGWQVTATAASRKNLAWRLVVRVVCAKAPAE